MALDSGTTHQQLIDTIAVAFPGVNSLADLQYALELLCYTKDALWAAGYKSVSDFGILTADLKATKLQNAVDLAQATIDKIRAEFNEVQGEAIAANAAQLAEAQGILNAAKAALADSITVA